MAQSEIHFTGDQDTGNFKLEYSGNIATEAGMLRLYLHLARAFGFDVPRTRFDREDRKCADS